jgi:hypothetical protein
MPIHSPTGPAIAMEIGIRASETKKSNGLDHDQQGPPGQPAGCDPADQHAHAGGGGDDRPLGGTATDLDDLPYERHDPHAAREQRHAHRRDEEPVPAVPEGARGRRLTGPT